jgi:hypothetical protein
MDRLPHFGLSVLRVHYTYSKEQSVLGPQKHLVSVTKIGRLMTFMEMWAGYSAQQIKRRYVQCNVKPTELQSSSTYNRSTDDITSTCWLLAYGAHKPPKVL